MSLPDVVSREQWLEARRQLLAREKEYTRSRDALNADRRRLPMVAVDREYVFEGPDGPVTLADLFGDKRQLIVQHVMYGPDWEQPCPGCSASLDSLSQGMLDQIGTRETTFALIARAPYEKISALAKERGWSFPWYSSFGSEFNYDYGVTLDADRGLVDYNYRPIPQALGDERSTELPGYSCFLREGDQIFHTYSTYGRGTDSLVGAYALLDLTALGRQEDWEEPKGRVEAVRGGDPTFTS
ncbi:MAG TPA: DUF899 domain-containing protein [Streptosporangiaceae bacterium]|nr:DUF899 domain-containing protein [Streptosporangiaceae bacterium]